MEHTPSVEEMIAVVQAYIKERKGVNIKIVLDDIYSIRKHTIMLNEAYNHVVSQNNNTNN